MRTDTLAHDVATRKAALRKAQQRREYVRGRMDYDEKFVPEREQKRNMAAVLGPTFTEFRPLFLRDYVGSDPRRSDYYNGMTADLARTFGPKHLRKITAADVDQFKAARAAEFRERRGREISPSTVRKLLGVLFTMFKQAKRWGLIESNPVENVDRPREPKHRTETLTRTEFDSMRGLLPEEYQGLALLFWNTGMRLEDAVCLTWKDVDFDRAMVWVANHKTGHGYMVGMNDTLRDVMSKQWDHVHSVARATGERTPFVFADFEGADYTSDARRRVVGRAFRPAQEQAGVFKGRPVHILRHSAASALADNGFSEIVIGAVLGHRDPKTTRRYTHLRTEATRAAVATLG